MNHERALQNEDTDTLNTQMLGWPVSLQILDQQLYKISPLLSPRFVAAPSIGYDVFYFNMIMLTLRMHVTVLRTWRICEALQVPLSPIARGLRSRIQGSIGADVKLRTPGPM